MLEVIVLMAYGCSKSELFAAVVGIIVDVF